MSVNRHTHEPAHICMHILGVAHSDVRVMREATALVEAGYRVSVVDVAFSRNDPSHEIIQGVEIHHVRLPSWYTPVRFKPWFLVKMLLAILLSTLQLLRLRADVYHAHSDIRELPACYLAAVLRKKPFVFDAHELPLSDPAVRRWKLLHSLALHMLKHIMKRCTAVITVSPPLIEELQHLCGGPRAILLRNVPIYRQVVRTERLREHLGLNKQVQITLYQGNLQANRGLERLIYAASTLAPNTVIVLMGYSRGRTKEHLQELIAREGVSERVKILPPVPYKELLDWTSSADLGLMVYSSDYSANVRVFLPNKLFEYSMAGLPVLSSNLPAVNEIITRYNFGQVLDSLEPAEIATAINTLLADEIARTTMRNNGLIAAQTSLCWEYERIQLYRLYTQLLGKATTDENNSTERDTRYAIH